MDIIEMIPEIYSVLSIDRWRQYMRLNYSKYAFDSPNLLYSKILRRDKFTEEEILLSDPILKILAAWIILKELEPNRTWEIRTTQRIELRNEGSLTIYRPFLRNGLKLILLPGIYSGTTYDKLIDDSRLVCTPRDFMNILGITSYGYDQLINDIRSLINVSKYNRIDIISLIERMMVPRSNFYKIAKESDIWAVEHDINAIKMVARGVFAMKMGKFFTLLLDRIKLPGCTNESIGFRTTNLAYRDTYLR
jgi:hypothetical protein